MTLLILFFTLSILFSFLCSIWEAVLLSITPSYVNRHVQDGTSVGHLLQEFKKDIDRPLSAILTLNTIAHTVGAIGVGAQAGQIFGNNAVKILGIQLGYESLIAGLMTLAILILSEIIPKTIGANMWRQLAPFTVKSIRILIYALWPLVWLSQRITKGLKRDKTKSVLSRADFAAMTRVGEESGALERNESLIIRNLLRLKELTVRDIMTPRTVMATADENLTCQAYYDANVDSPFSRIPIYGNDPDDITGMVLKTDILAQVAADNHEMKLSALKIPVSFIEDSVPLPNLIESLSHKRAHLAIVVDNYGSISGLVTMEDLMETLLGIEIMDETDTVADLQKLARVEWQKRAKVVGLIE
ncbi:MAG: HlyC/CorC family transporter [Saprospiraceae bacterium]|nr:HlyC/CorC family transporter [Saprospiraceae bacterium]